MEPIRREALVKATIAEIGATGSLEVTVSKIAKRAGMSPALAHHYFGSKERLFLAAMQHLLTVYGAWVRRELVAAETPRARLEALIRASFEAGNFEPEVIAAWLNFYVHAQSDAGAARLLRVYHARLRSNLVHDLRPLAGHKAPEIAETVAALIDGVYIRHALGTPPDGVSAVARVTDVLDRLLEAR
jgi:TetR/AcrR family transcriptional repressor of bet genes